MVQLWIPGIDDLIVRGAVHEPDALGARAVVVRARKRVVEIELNTMGHRMPEHDLRRIVRAVSNRPPRVQRGELIVEELESLRLLSVDGGACWEAVTARVWQVEDFQHGCFVAAKTAREKVINVLRRSGVCGSARIAPRNAGSSSTSREEVFPVRYRLNGAFRCSCVEELIQLCHRPEV